MYNNKIKRIVLLFLVIGILFLSSCFVEKIIDNDEDGKVNASDIINANFGLDITKVASYTEISDTDAATVVANIVMPATVEITCTIYFTYTYTYGGWGGFGQKTVSDSESCSATGFFINSDGYLMTNAHVVTISNESLYRDLKYTDRDIQISYADSDIYFDVDVVAYDTTLDLAILKMKDSGEISNIQYVTFFNLTSHNSEEYKTDNAVKLYYGEYVIAIGNANGYGISVTTGVVSAPYRCFTENNVITEAIQTDAAINEGNSGGPLVNKYGAVIGINSFKIATNTTDNLGFAIPSDVVINYINTVNTNKSLEIAYSVTNERAYN